MNMLAVAETVHPDEKCQAVTERHVAVDGHGWRRVQSTYFLRGNQWFVYRVDLGAASDFAKEQFSIICLGEDSVGKAWEMAEHDRLADDYWQKFLAEKAAESTFKADTIRFFEERAQVAQNRSAFGPLIRKQRNAFISREKVRQVHGRNR